MKTGILFVPACVFLQTRTTAILVRIDEPPDQDRVFNLDQVNSRFRWSVAEINRADTTSHSACELHIDPDSTRFSDIYSRVRYSVATTDILSIERKDHLTGILTGGALGILTGLTRTAAVLAPQRDEYSGERALGALGIMIGITGGSAIVGAITGAAMGNTERFDFDLSRKTVMDSGKTKSGASDDFPSRH